MEWICYFFLMIFLSTIYSFLIFCKLLRYYTKFIFTMWYLFKCLQHCNQFIDFAFSNFFLKISYVGSCIFRCFLFLSYFPISPVLFSACTILNVFKNVFGVKLRQRFSPKYAQKVQPSCDLQT